MRKCWLYLLMATALVACTTEDVPDPAAADASVSPPCTDADGDGFGLGCAAGLDCDDADPASTNECRGCAENETGCACDGTVAEEACYLDPVDVGGRPLCHAGTRFCRDAKWTSCLQLTAYELPGSITGGARAALVTGPVACNDCNPSCYSTTDTPGPADLPGSGVGVVYAPVPGGITLPGTVGGGTLVDTDGDGVPDVYDSQPANPLVTGFEGGFFHVLPLGATALDPLLLTVQIRTADVYFLMDTTGSMGGEITNLKSTLTTTVIPSILTAIPDAWFGVGRHDDYPIGAYGAASWGDQPFQHLLDITNNLANITTAVGSLGTRNGNDWPESQTQALWSIATGSALGTYTVAKVCPAGYFGYPCFRPGTVPIVVLLTDAPYHNGPTPGYDYSPADFGGGYPYYALPATVGVPTGGSAFAPLPATVAAGGAPDTWATAKAIGTITTSAVSFSGSTATMTSNYESSCRNQTGARDVAYSFTLTSATRLQIDTNGTSFNTAVSVWTHPTLPAVPAEMAGLCDASGGTNSILDVTLAAGDYYILLDGRRTSNSGNYVLNVSPFVAGPPAPETYATAYATGDRTNSSASYSGSTCSMTNDYGGSCGAGGAGDAVFSFTLTAPRHVMIDTVGSGFDTSLSLRNAAMTEVSCNDDSVGAQSRLEADLVAGTYYVIVDGYGTSCGNYVLNLRTASGPSTGFAPPTWAQTVAALNARSIKVIVVESSDGYDRARSDADALCTATGTVSSLGAPLRYSISSSGAGLGATIATAISDLANYSRMDITGRPNDNLATAGFDERTFVASITAVSFPPGRCTGITGGLPSGQFNQCLPGTTVNFQVNFAGVVAATAVAQRFDFTIDVLGNGTTILSTVPVTIVIPPVAPTYPVSGTYFRDYDATASCTGVAVDGGVPSTALPRWRNLSWTATFPAGTSIRWTLQSAPTNAGLAAATPVSFIAPASTSPQDMGNALLAAGVPATLPHLRVTATLNSDAMRASAPTLSTFNVIFDCVPGE